MKKTLLAVLLCVMFVGCASTKSTKNFVSNYVTETNDGIMYVNVIEYGVSKKSAASQAAFDAICDMLFHGVSMSKSRQRPMIPNKEESMEEHPDYYNRFFNGAYSVFIFDSRITGEGKTQNHSKYYTVSVGIRHNALYDDLVNHKVIKKFGFY